METGIGVVGRGVCVPSRAGQAGGGRPLRASNKRIGAAGEEAAARYLQDEGYEIVERNWHCSVGEVDIVARGLDPRQAILVEVKTRRVPQVDAPVAPELAVGPKKRARYRTMALMYLSLNAEVSAVRFDVIGVGLTDSGQSKIRHLEGAYGWDDTL